MRTANRVTGLVAGALLTVLGVVGILVSASDGFTGAGVPLAGVLTTNPLLGLIQAVLGAALLGAAIVAQRASLIVNSVVGALLLVLGLTGLFLVGSADNVIAASATVNAVHFGASALLLLVALGADRPAAGPPA